MRAIRILTHISRPDSFVFVFVTDTDHGHDFNVERNPEELKGEGN